MTHLGPIVTRSLVRNIGGHAARSELDKLCEPLKKLIINCAAAQRWLQAALFEGHDGADGSSGNGGGGGGGNGAGDGSSNGSSGVAGGCFPGAERVGPEERITFLRKIMA